jgi:hypothetical protein
MNIPSNIKIIEHSVFARCAALCMRSSSVALVLGNHIFLWGTSQKNFVANNRWVKHELKHVEQYKKLGTSKFLLAYIWEWMRHGYTKNKFEIEARAAESTPDV